MNGDEIKKDAPSYTYITLRELKERYPDAVFFFLLGEDGFFAFDSWRCPDIISQSADIVTAVRHFSDGKTEISRDIGRQADYLRSRFAGDFHVLVTDYVDISSSMIREKIAAGEDVSGFLPESVRRYIKRHHLYKDEGAFGEGRALSPKRDKSGKTGKADDFAKRRQRMEKQLQKEFQLT